jgi:hypothetical protein
MTIKLLWLATNKIRFYIKYLCLISILFFLSCKAQKDEYYEINPLKFSEEKFVLSDIATNIQYIPLDNAFPIGLIYTIKANNNSFFLSTKDEGIIQFDWNGNFIHKIAKKGNGPDEYKYGMQFTFDEKSRYIYVVDFKKIKVYDSSGEFLKDIPTTKYFSGAAGGIEVLGNYLFLSDFGTYGKFKYCWIIIDTLGNLVSTKRSLMQSTGYVVEGDIYKYHNNLYYYNMLNDTIFSISPNLKISTAYLFAKGEHRWPKNGIEIKSINANRLLDIFRIGKMFESKNYIFLVYGYKTRSAFLAIEKRTKRNCQSYTEVNKKYVKSIPRIINDFDEGLDINIEPTIDYFKINNSDYIICFINPFELKAHVLTDKFNNSIPKYPEKKKALEKLANSLDENDNPVLMLVKLKD